MIDWRLRYDMSACNGWGFFFFLSFHQNGVFHGRGGIDKWVVATSAIYLVT